MGRLFRVLLICAAVSAAAPAAAQTGPAPAMLTEDPQVLALGCAPSLVYAVPAATLRVTGGQSVTKRYSHAPGDLVTINAGSEQGIQVGQEFFARRVLTDRGVSIGKNTPGVLRTTGWLRVWAVDPTMSLATVTYACETIDVGDYLEPYTRPQMPAISSEPLRPEKGNYGRVMIGADRRSMFGKGDFVVVDRGRAQGVTPGARFVIFRDKSQSENFLFDLGEAVAVDVKENSATLQVTLSRNALFAGDYVAMRKDPEPAGR